MLKHSLAIGLFIGMNALAHAAPEKSPWVQIYKDENGKTFVNTQVALAEKNQEQLKKFGYKYIYTYGVPSLKIAPKGYVQGVHIINCADQTRAYVTSQRFKPNGVAIDPVVEYPQIFEPMDLQSAEIAALYQYVCHPEN